LFMGGQLKIAGNVMASTKLGFLKKLDMKAAQALIAAHRAKGSTSAAAAPVAAAPKAAHAPAIADKLASKLAGLTLEQAVTLQLRIKEPASAWILSLGPQGGSITAGEADKPGATVTLADDDLLALVQGKASAQALFQRGALRVDGDARLAHHLSLLAGAV
jgi:3-hydroxyacyl-CoA dehydrogenase/3a,7a,12a-trihydroxy-5b-cholest-24-enoyl-CoA hydratase